MARRSYRTPARREWLVPCVIDENDQAAHIKVTLNDANIPLGYQAVGDDGTKIMTNALGAVTNFRDPVAPAGAPAVTIPFGPYTIERIVGSVNFSTDETDAGIYVGLTIMGVFDTGNPYEATGTDPTIDQLRTQPGVMHCASGAVIAANSGPASRTIDIDVRTKRTVVPGKSFYMINHTMNSGDQDITYLHVIKVLVRYAS